MKNSCCCCRCSLCLRSTAAKSVVLLAPASSFDGVCCRCHSKTELPCSLRLYCRLATFPTAKMASHNMSAEDVMDEDTFYTVFWLTRIFCRIYWSQSIQPKKCSAERSRLWLHFEGKQLVRNASWYM